MIALVLPWATVTAHADGDLADGRIRLSASVAYEYDDNVTVPDVDRSSGEGASAGVFEVGFDADAYESETLAVELGYDFFQSLYAEDEVDALDLRLHLPWLALTTEARGIDFDLSWRSSIAHLGNEAYFDTHALGPTVGYLFGESVYASAGYFYQYRSFDRSNRLVGPTNDRTAHRHTISGDALWLVRRFDLRLLGRLWYRVEDATENHEFDYDAVGVRVGLDWPLPVRGIGQGPPEFQFRLGYEDRSYAGDSRVLTRDGARRQDERLQLSLGFELPLYRMLFGQMTYEHFDAESNDPNTDYETNLVRLAVEFRL